MKLLLLLIIFSFGFMTAMAQSDSVSANYIRTEVDRIETNLPADIELSTDTTIIDKDGTMTVHTSYYFLHGSSDIEKIKEKTLFGEVTTEIVVYYSARSPILFSSKQWQGSQLKVDFDYYFQANSPLYLVKREFGSGKPDSEQILKWCNELLKESQNKNLVKLNEETGPKKKTINPKQTAPKTKKSILPFFKKKKN